MALVICIFFNHVWSQSCNFWSEEWQLYIQFLLVWVPERWDTWALVAARLRSGCSQWNRWTLPKLKARELVEGFQMPLGRLFFREIAFKHFLFFDLANGCTWCLEIGGWSLRSPQPSSNLAIPWDLLCLIQGLWVSSSQKLLLQNLLNLIDSTVDEENLVPFETWYFCH